MSKPPNYQYEGNKRDTKTIHDITSLVGVKGKFNCFYEVEEELNLLNTCHELCLDCMSTIVISADYTNDTAVYATISYFPEKLYKFFSYLLKNYT